MMSGGKNMKILFVSAEVRPFIKTGGLGDVSFELPKALREKGEDIRIILPKYGDIPLNYTSKTNLIASFGVNVGWRNQYCGLEYLNYDGIPVYFIDNEYYFKRRGCYGYFDDGERFAYFCRAVLESVRYMGDFTPDIIHCNDWQTGMIPVFLKDVYFSRPEFVNTRTVYTIHNLKYQGIFTPLILGDLLGLGPEYDSEEKLRFRDGVSFMKGGIVYTDMITTVSETYAQEIQTPEYGEGLDGLLRKNSGKLRGITNGIDKSVTAASSAGYPAKKSESKAALQKAVGLPENPDVPVISMITRLVRQKGIDLVIRVMEEILKMDVQFVLLGSGDQDYQDFFEYYASSYPGKISVSIKFDPALASAIYAGSDIFLMPSLFEPCGLSQMIAMSYGTLPLVRETGGLKDTVKPYNEFTGDGNGFSFTNYNAHDMLHVIEYAVSLYKNKEIWRRLMKNAMRSGFDWDTQADKYLKMYSEITEA